ncbi:hypothetical protein Sjap_004256 [Stephania japonica]|uniref:Uncharacterized protein n=1 Tax=Stephania japonica TaxID=461633 RepID=A0AAP0PGV6_9MAGN
MQLSRGQSSHASNKDAMNQYANDEMSMVSSTTSELDWIEPSLVFNYPRALESYGTERVYEALHLLQTEPLIQKIVSSLSTDKAVWEAVLNNEVVHELRDSCTEGGTPDGSDRGASSIKSILKQMLDNLTAKIISLAEKVRKLVNEVILHSTKKVTTGGANLLGEKLISSVMLSIIVLLIVVVTRASRA